MKKKLSILVAIFLIATIFMPSKAEAATCIHESFPGTVLSSWITGWSDIGSTHKRDLVCIVRCHGCQESYMTQGRYKEEPHSWGSWQDGGHIAGTHTHKQISFCSVDCGAARTRTYSCPGNPCQYPV